MKSDSDALIEALAIMSGLLLGGPTMHMDRASRETIRAFLDRETEPIGTGRGRSFAPPDGFSGRMVLPVQGRFRGDDPGALDPL